MFCRLLFIYNHLSLLHVGLKQSFIKRTFAGHLPIMRSGAVLGSSYSLCLPRVCLGVPREARGGGLSVCRARRRGPGERRALWAGCLRVVRTTAPEEFFIICQVKGLYSPSRLLTANIALSSQEASCKSLDPASWQQGHSRYGEGLLAMGRAMVM